MQQLPVLPPDAMARESSWSSGPVGSWIESRVNWLNENNDADKRRQVSAELDAAFFRLYGLSRDEVSYVMDSFPILKRKDMAKFGEYRTSRDILHVFDALRDSDETGKPYVSSLDGTQS